MPKFQKTGNWQYYFFGNQVQEKGEERKGEMERVRRRKRGRGEM